MTATIIIVGRPNVGKSTLFNRLSRSKSALVDNHPGVTRDRICTTANYKGISFILVDTGGFDDLDTNPFAKGINEQVKSAITDADRIIFMGDGQQGILPVDEEIAQILRLSGKKVFLAVNKVDGIEHEHLCTDFYRLGIKDVYPISAAHGYGIKQLMHDVLKGLENHEPHIASHSEIRVSLMGKPNAGKSSVINRILGEDRILVSNIPGTTRDTVDIPFTYRGKEYLLIDTAGIRKKTRVKDKIDTFSMIKAIKSLNRCHVAVIIIDVSQGITEQDLRICSYALEQGRGIVLAINKWDLVKEDQYRKRLFLNEMERKTRHLAFAPTIHISALTGEGVLKIFDSIDIVYRDFVTRIPTAAVNRALREIVEKHPHPRLARGTLKFAYATEVKTSPPTFVLFVNRPDKVDTSYQRYLINQFRKYFNIPHTPINLILKKKGENRTFQ